MAVSVKTEVLPNSQVALEISVGPEECSQAWNTILGDLTKRADIAGFRKGKAPKQLIINHFGRQSIEASACEEVIEKGVKAAITSEGINAIGQAVLDEGEGDISKVIAAYKPDQALSFRVKVDVWPEPKLTGSYEGLEITAEEVDLDDSILDDALRELQRKEAFSVLSPEGTKAALGKLVIADMHGFYREEDNSKGGPLPDIAEGEKVEIKMKEGQYMPGFVEGIIGMDVGETRSVNVQFPEANARPQLAGVKAIFDVTVHAIKDEVLPELDDDFAQRATGSPSMDALRESLKARLSVETESTTNANINRAIEDALAEITEVTLPETMVEERVKNKFAKMLSDFKERGMADEQVKAMVTKENYELYRKRALKNVERSLVVNFAITKISSELEFTAPQDEVDGQMELIRAEMRGEEMDEENLKDQVIAQLERDMVFAHIKKSAKITLEKPEPKAKDAQLAPVEVMSSDSS
jgi:trigger factor